ncbi:MAG: carboxypeptidase-like regulatory domain-containing protein [Planctomycetota bacterium]
MMSRKTVAAIFLIVAVLLSAPHLSAATDAAETAGESQAWYILRQDDCRLLGPMVLSLADAAAGSREGAVWGEAEGGGTVQIDLAVEGDVSGEILVGFFEKADWSSPARRVQVFEGPGVYLVKGLPPGKYHVGAMIKSGEWPEALGVHRQWPEPVSVIAGKTTKASVLVSTEFRHAKQDYHHNEEALKPQNGEGEVPNLVTVRTVDAEGDPVPFCDITFVDRGKQVVFYGAITDRDGYARCNRIRGAFSLMAQRYEVLPEVFVQRIEHKKIAALHNAQDEPEITITWDPFPAGRGKITGTVKDQNGRPLDRYYITVSQRRGERMDWSEAYAFWVALPVINEEGRFEISDLVPGEYSVMVRHFDYTAYVWDFDMDRFTIPEDSDEPVELNFVVEAKELFYGRAVYEDGSPVHPGYWYARFAEEEGDGRGSFRLNTEPDGSFRVSLSRAEREDVLKNLQGMIEVGGYKPTGEGDGTMDKWPTEVSIEILSKDPANPSVVVVPAPGD